MSIKKAVIIRTIILILALLNNALVLAGHSPLPFDNEQLEFAITSAFTVFVALWTWWKDNDITRKARRRKAKLDELERKNQFHIDKLK